MARARAELPVATAAVVLAALLVFVIPGGFALTVFDRDAVAAGEWWRLLTGSLAHYSARHLAGDVVIVAFGGWVAERHDRRALLVLLGGAMLASTIGALVASPQRNCYAGLSGVGYALTVWIALDVVRMHDRRARLLGVAVATAVAAKVAWSFHSPHLLPGSSDVAVAETSHAAAAMFAAAAWLVLNLAAKRRLTARPAGTA